MRSVHTATATAMIAAAAGCLALTGLPAQATSARLTPPATAGSCRYELNHLAPGESIPVHSAPRRNARVLGQLRSGAGVIAGACAGKGGWLHVTTPAGIRGWASGHHLRKLPTGTGGSARMGTPAGACRYSVTGVRRISHLNVRSGAGLRYRPIAALKAGAHAIAGTCAGRRGWLRVTTPAGVHGWAWNGYLRKSATVSPRSAT
ncbi:SH3 domain-containing protein [Nonomuraea sp. NPDC005650]|uniref:SH3 domain-containing protein n=1 Tax=Nonomuraea sp. NPDC005650 TaxID=3157045 RepID=UPI00339DE636